MGRAPCRRRRRQQPELRAGRHAARPRSRREATGWDYLAILPAVTLATTLPISLGGWGVREGVFVLLLGVLACLGRKRFRSRCCLAFFGMVAGFPGLLAWAIGGRGRTDRDVPSADALSFPPAGADDNG